MLRHADEKYKQKLKSKLAAHSNLSNENGTHQLSLHARSGRNKFWSEAIFPLCLCILCPFFIRSIVFISDHCHGSMMEFFSRLLFDPTLSLKFVLKQFFYFQWHWPSALIMLGFLAYSIVMTMLLPGVDYAGPITDTGHVPIYRNNGFIYYLVSLVTFAFVSVLLKFFDLSPTYVYDHWEQFLSTVNTFAFILCFLVMLKGKYTPSTADHRSSSNWIIDFYRGVELYPRVFGIDIKLITNCRYGMLSWALLSVIFCMKTFELHGYTDSALVTCVLTLVYLTKFFWWESGRSSQNHCSFSAQRFFTVRLHENDGHHRGSSWFLSLLGLPCVGVWPLHVALLRACCASPTAWPCTNIGYSSLGFAFHLCELRLWSTENRCSLSARPMSSLEQTSAHHSCQISPVERQRVGKYSSSLWLLVVVPALPLHSRIDLSFSLDMSLWFPAHLTVHLFPVPLRFAHASCSSGWSEVSTEIWHSLERVLSNRALESVARYLLNFSLSKHCSCISFFLTTKQKQIQ